MKNDFTPYATFERQKSVFRDHPPVFVHTMIKSAAATEYDTGAILATDNSGNVILAQNGTTAANMLGVLFGHVELDAGVETPAVIAIHADVIKEQCKVDPAASIDNVAKNLRLLGIYCY